MFFRRLVILGIEGRGFLQQSGKQLHNERSCSISFQRYCSTTTNDDGPRKTKNPFAGEVNKLEETSNDDKERRLKVLKLEADIAYQEGRRVPQLDFFTEHHWEHVLSLPSKSARSKYYAYLWQIEKKKESKEVKKQIQLEQGLQRRDEIRQERAQNDHIIYGLAHTSMFLRFYDTTINHFHNNKLIKAMQFAPKVVIDCSYDAHMTPREAKNAAKQLMISFADNRAHDDPFDLHYCNANHQGICMQSLKRYIPTMLNPDFPMNVHTECFTEIFDKEKLVYLTPHCRTDLQSYNADDVYIIGAMVDKVNNEPLSLAKAKKLGIRMARLPLDHHLQWGCGSGKSLTINQMVNILLDLHRTNDWQKALEHVPRRKIIDEKTEFLRQKNNLRKRAVQLSMGLDGIAVEGGNGRRERKDSGPVRSKKKDYQFELNTWASKKKREQIH